jgi:hypothetical protein
MQEFDRVHYAQFEIFYYNTLVINYSEINLSKAIEILEELSQKANSEALPYYGLFIHLNLSLFYFEKRMFKHSFLHLQKLYKHKGYENTDSGMKLKINIGELMLRYENKEPEVAIYRLKQVIKDFEDTLSLPAFEREKEMLGIMGIFFQKGRTGDITERTRLLITGFDTARKDEGENLFQYETWLKEKLNL